MKKLTCSYFGRAMYLYFLVIFFYSCNNQKPGEKIVNELREVNTTQVIQIDPENFELNEFTLSDIASDLNYIPIDNKYLVGRNRYFKIRNDAIYLNIEDSLLVKFDMNGNNPLPIGRKGRGPGEYLYCNSYAIDKETNNIYIRGKREVIMVYSPKGDFIREFQLPHNEDESVFSDIEFLDSSLFIAQYIQLGKAAYNWIITDTSGVIRSQRKNYLFPFESSTGNFGGVYEFNDNLSYWDIYNDTVFKITSDFKYSPSCILPGDFRNSLEGIVFNSPQQYMEDMAKICMTLKLFETNNFWAYRYRYNMYGIAFIDKKSNKTLFSLRDYDSWGIENDLDGGMAFLPEDYYTENGNEYLVSIIDSYNLKTFVSSNSFRNYMPKYPEKKKALETLAANLKETDNPVLVVVTLKE